MNKSDVRAIISQENPEIVADLLRYASDLRTTGNIKAAADIKLQLLKLVMDTSEAEDEEGVVFTVVRRASGPAS